MKKVFLKISHNSLENIYIKKESLTQAFSFFIKHLRSLFLIFRDTKQSRKRHENVNYIWKNPVLKKMLEDIR